MRTHIHIHVNDTDFNHTPKTIQTTRAYICDQVKAHVIL